MDIRVGIAPDSWGIWFPNDPKQMPWQRCLDEMAEAGYQWIELGPYGYLPTDSAVLRRELDSRGLIPVTQTVDQLPLEDPAAWPSIEKTVSASAALLASLGAPYFVIIDSTYSNLATGETLAPRTLAESEWVRLVDTTNRIADLVSRQFGLKLLFHPHAETHVEYQEQIERLLNDTEPARIGICFDTGHHAYRGGDAVRFMREHSDRIPFLHLKNVDPKVQQRVEQEGIPFAKAVGMDMFVEPSEGAVDFAAFRDVLQEIDYDGYAIVEQDMYPAPFDKPLAIAARTRKYLRDIGIG